MTDPITREDLEMAAKAAGLEVLWDEVDEAYLLVEDDASARTDDLRTFYLLVAEAMEST